MVKRRYTNAIYLFKLGVFKSEKRSEMGAFFYAQRFVKNFVYTLLENNHYICLDTNQ